MSVVEKEREPREVTHTIVDITTKEFTNRGKDVVDETMIKLHKTTATPRGEKYRFTTPGGVNFAWIRWQYRSPGDLWWQLTEFSGTSKLKNETYSLSYNREEKISVSPATPVTAKIVSYSNKYEMLYTLKFRVSRNAVVPLLYKTRCCLFTCKNQRSLYTTFAPASWLCSNKCKSIDTKRSTDAGSMLQGRPCKVYNYRARINLYWTQVKILAVESHVAPKMCSILISYFSPPPP